jgi:predicted homoserine dehydrogenase-like protein
MNYKKIFQTSRVIKVGLIGTGAFGNSFLFQAQAVPQIDIAAVCDRDVSIARQASLRAGIGEDRLVVCSTIDKLRSTIERGKIAVVEDPLLMMDTSIDVVVEATGMPEPGAKHAKAAIENGKHVVMVSKETDVTVGPILARLAANQGVVYTPADGDQPSLLLGLISWAETLGFEIVCAGKSSERDFLYDVAAGTVSNGQEWVEVVEEGQWKLWDILLPGEVEKVIEQRGQALAAIPQIAVPDLAEMAIVINSSELDYDTARLRAPIARISELPEVLRSCESGGILASTGVVDVVNCLRRTDEVSLAGGVFVVVKCYHAPTWELLAEKGHVVSRDRSHALIYQPWHLLGVETATSILSAVVLGQPTGGSEVKPRVDLGIRASTSFKSGQPLVMGGHHHTISGTEPELIPAVAHQPDHPIPFYLAANNVLKTDIAAGTLLTYAMVEPALDSELWKLKQLQAKTFLET